MGDFFDYRPSPSAAVESFKLIVEKSAAAPSTTGLWESDLRSFCEAATRAINQVVYDIKKSNGVNFFGGFDNSLKVFGVCGPASDALGVVLSIAGFDVHKCKTLSDKESHPGSLGPQYIYDDHQFLLVSIQGQRYIVDPAYIQFLTMLPETLEKKGERPDILIIPEAQFGLWVESMVNLCDGKDLSLRYRKGESVNVKIPNDRESLTTYFSRIWQFDASHYQVSEPGHYRRALDQFRDGGWGWQDGNPAAEALCALHQRRLLGPWNKPTPF